MALVLVPLREGESERIPSVALWSKLGWVRREGRDWRSQASRRWEANVYFCTGEVGPSTRTELGAGRGPALIVDATIITQEVK